MGAGQSIPQTMPSVDRYKKSTDETSAIMNYVFKWMLNEVEIRDLLNLANPKYCKEYIFLTKEALDKYFTHIQLEPKLGKGSVLYFQKAKSLTFTDEKSETLAKEDKLFRDTMCSQLAFFYVRIFQVFGALALTVIDTLPEAGLSIQAIRQGLVGIPTQRPPGFGSYKGGGATKIASWSTDAATLGTLYTVAASYLRKPDTSSSVEFVILEDPSFDTKSKTYTQNSVRTLLYYPSEPVYNLYYNASAQIEVKCAMEITNYTPSNYNIKIRNIEVNDEPISRSFDIPMKKDRNDYFYKRLSIGKVLTVILDAMASENKRNRNVEELLGDIGKAGVSKNTKIEDTGAPEGLKTGSIIDAVAKRPKAYCVARAIQLLSPTLLDNIRSGIPIRSEICYSGAVPGLTDAIPYYGQVITNHVPSLRVLHQLFFDELLTLTPKISDATLPKYREFVRIMQEIYAETPPTSVKTEINQVVNEQLRGCSGTYKDNQLILTNSNSIRKVRQHVAELMNYQMKHSANVLNFMKRKMLDYSGGRFQGISRTLLEGGIPAVNKIADEARELLIEYYKICESTYRKGAHEVLASPGLVTQPPRK